MLIGDAHDGEVGHEVDVAEDAEDGRERNERAAEALRHVEGREEEEGGRGTQRDRADDGRHERVVQNHRRRRDSSTHDHRQHQKHCKNKNR